MKSKQPAITILCLLGGILSLAPLAGAAPVEGDGVIENSRISVQVRKSDGKIIIFHQGTGAPREAVQIAVAIGDDFAARFTSIVPDPAGSGEKAIIAKGTTARGGSIALRLSVAGERPTVEFSRIDGVTALNLSYRAAHAVLPEIFGDDLVFRPGEAKETALRLPADHALLHTLEDGDALLLCAWPPASKEILVQSGKVEERARFTRTDLPWTGSEKLSVSVLAEKSIWHEAESSQFTISEYRPLEWKPPFPARYRCDLRREGMWGQTDSWMRQPRKDKFWMAFLSNGFPPLVMDSGGPVLRIPRFRPGLPFPSKLPPEIRFTGPVLIYPFERETDPKAGETPEGDRTVLDVLRGELGADWKSALGIGEGILSVEPFPKGFVFAATCVCTGAVEELFSKGKEKDEAAKIRRTFDDMNLFVRYHRERIEEYVAYAAAWQKSIADFHASHPSIPELELALADLEPLLSYFPELLEKSRETIKTPEGCRELTEKAIALIDKPGSDRLAPVKELGVAMRTIGGRQDDILSGYRMAVKAFRQRAGQIHAVAREAPVRELMRKLRDATRAPLRTCSPYEEFLFLSASWLVQKQ